MSQAETTASKVDTWSANEYNKVATFVYSSKYTSKVIQLLDPKPGERVVDFGCGSGEVSLEIARVLERSKGGEIIGVDSSQSMVRNSPSGPPNPHVSNSIG
jgi:ubiquinone/menaquinone biosynthesis C-methylase UbiE